MYGDGSQAHLTDGGKPLPQITPLNEKFWALTRKSVFSLQTCKACGDQHVPESPVCPCLRHPPSCLRALFGCSAPPVAI